MEEIWKDIKGYEGYYQVSNLGRIRSCRYDKLLEGYPDKDGYISICLCVNYKSKRFQIHRLVAETFIPNLYNLPEVNHKDENPSNNNSNNLEWCDRIYNMNYGTCKYRMGLHRRKPVNQYSKEGKFIKEYSSMKEAAILNNIKLNNISCCCNHIKNYKTAGGYIWKFKED